MVGEACPYYMFHPAVPARIAEHLPEVKLIAVLRDPVARAWSAVPPRVPAGATSRSVRGRPRCRGGPPRRRRRGAAGGPRPALLAPAPRVRRPRPLRRAARAALDPRRPRPLPRAVQPPTSSATRRAVMQRVHDFLGIPVRPTPTTDRWNRQDTTRARAAAAGPARRGLRGVRRLAGRAPRGATAVAQMTAARPRGRPRPRRGDPHGRRLDARARAAPSTRSARSASRSPRFALVTILTRSLGARGAGAFLESVAVFSIISRTSVLGADLGLVRFVSRFRGVGRVGSIRPMIVIALGARAGGVERHRGRVVRAGRAARRGSSPTRRPRTRWRRTCACSPRSSRSARST